MSNLSELRKRVEGASGGDRELDLALHLAFFPDGEIAKLQSCRRGFDHEPGMAWDIYGASVCFEKYTDDGRCTYNGGYPLPALTASIDAALALVEREPRHLAFSAVILDRARLLALDMQIRAQAKTIAEFLPRCIVIEYLRALEQQEQDGNG